MRLVNLYQVYDRRARNMMGPLVAAQNEIPLARELAQAVNDDKTIIGQHPDDFDVVLLGTQDMDTGRIEALSTPEFVFTCRDLLKKERTQHGEP